MIAECYTAGSIWTVAAMAFGLGCPVGAGVMFLWMQRVVRRAIENYRPPQDWLRR